MKLAKGSVVALDYRLHLGDGVTVGASEGGEPLQYIHGEGQIVPGLEAALEGLEAGSTRQVVVEPADGYGDYDSKGLQEVSHDAFGGRLPDVGGQYLARGPDGESVPFSVKEMRDATVLVDLNRLQISGDTARVMPQDIRANFESDGWRVLEIDGHDFGQIYGALREAVRDEKHCVAILAHTVMGKGANVRAARSSFPGIIALPSLLIGSCPGWWIGSWSSS